MTSNVTGRHRGPKPKLRAACYRAPSLQCTSYLHVCVGLLCCASSIFHRWVWYISLRYVRAMRVFDVRASSTPQGYPCAKFRFCSTLHCWASPWRKIAYSITQSFTESLSHSPSLFDAPGIKPFASEYCQKLDSIGHISVADSMGLLASVNLTQWTPKQSILGICI